MRCPSIDARTLFINRRYNSPRTFGTRPTVQGRELLLEVHIFDFDADIYGRRIEVEFVERLRGEKKFDGVEAMTEQVRRDAARAREILASID